MATDDLPTPDEWMAPIFKQFARSTSEFVKNRCVSELAAGKMSAVEYNRALRINSLIDSYKTAYDGKSVDIFRCSERLRAYIQIQDLIVKQTQCWKILGPMHLTNPYDARISIHRFMSGGAVTEARLGVIARYCADHRETEADFIPDVDFEERLALTRGDITAINADEATREKGEKIVEIEAGETSEVPDQAQSTIQNLPGSVTINAGNIVFPTSLSPISSSPIPSNPAKKRKLMLLEELAEGMKSMTANFSQLLHEVKEANRGDGDSFDIISNNQN